MSYQQKMTRHLQGAEKRDAQVDAIEQKAMSTVGITDPDVMNRIDAYKLRKELEPNDLYKQRSGSRNYHVAMATMYALAALVEEVVEQ